MSITKICNSIVGCVVKALPFCSRWRDKLAIYKYLLQLHLLNLTSTFPPLYYEGCSTETKLGGQQQNLASQI